MDIHRFPSQQSSTRVGTLPPAPKGQGCRLGPESGVFPSEKLVDSEEGSL